MRCSYREVSLEKCVESVDVWVHIAGVHLLPCLPHEVHITVCHRLEPTRSLCDVPFSINARANTYHVLQKRNSRTCSSVQNAYCLKTRTALKQCVAQNNRQQIGRLVRDQIGQDLARSSGNISV